MVNVQDTALVLIDVQGKLAQVMHDSEALLSELEKLVQGAKILNIPILWVEQYPKGLGPTAEKLSKHLTDEAPIAKMEFSAYKNEQFKTALEKLNRQTMIVAGIESHVCVYQTVKDLLQANYHVEVVTDGVSSRTARNSEIGAEKMVSLGAKQTSVEMVLFELLETAEHENFREISRLIK